ncbi:Deoxyribodipyrimidine photo-lyase [Anoxybacillus sp. BCO1]|nr:Deoxyribodipyrimidine photo-lyase [Anoxybacillus sp. BCO1]
MMNALKFGKEGKTGFPLVDAGMRQLKKEGWMHNRLRMVVASFLTKDYLIDWRMGEQYFQHMLIDYDEASNIGGGNGLLLSGQMLYRIFASLTRLNNRKSLTQTAHIFAHMYQNLLLSLRHIFMSHGKVT